MKCISRCSPYNIAALVAISLISSLKKAAGQLHSKKTSHYTDTDRVERWYPLEKSGADSALSNNIETLYLTQNRCIITSRVNATE